MTSRFSEAIRWALIIVLLTPALAFCEISDSGEDIVIADYLDWKITPAVYVVAEQSTHTKMQKAVENAVTSGRYDCSAKLPYSWVCGQSALRFFRGIGGNGKASHIGLVCQDDWQMKSLKYYSVELLVVGENCVKLEYFEDDDEWWAYGPNRK